MRPQAICFLRSADRARGISPELLYKKDPKKVLERCRSRCAIEFEWQQLKWSSTAKTKSSGRRLDFNFTLVLGARAESKCTARTLNNNGTGTFVWIIHKLIESDL
jgi:hypothetical protein